MFESNSKFPKIFVYMMSLLAVIMFIGMFFGVDFVGSHPMAGREVGGYQSSTDTLFNKASWIITPTKRNKPESVSLIRELADYVGCRCVMSTTPEEHDEIIAYTSQLMHVVAVALCDNPMIERSASFSAGRRRS